MRPWLRWTALAGIVLALILVPFALWEGSISAFSSRLLSQTAGRAVVASAAIALLTGDVLLPVPSSVVSAGAVSLLGAWQGGAVIAVGMTGAAWLGYGIGRWGGEPLVRRLVGVTELARARRLMDRHGSWVLLLGRGLPVVAEATTLLAGATRLPAGRFALVTGLSHLGLAGAYAATETIERPETYGTFPFLLGSVIPGLSVLLFSRYGSPNATSPAATATEHEPSRERNRARPRRTLSGAQRR